MDLWDATLRRMNINYVESVAIQLPSYKSRNISKLGGFTVPVSTICIFSHHSEKGLYKAVADKFGRNALTM